MQLDNNKNDILKKAIANFFPEEGNWSFNCFRKSKKLKMKNLPCHLRDNEWLANMIKKEKKLTYISVEEILEFITNSEEFQEKRHSYEQEIVKQQIILMDKGEKNWLIDEEYGGDLIWLNPKCDIGFRKGIVDTLSAIGIDKEAIEEGIEKNSNLWKESYMKSAYYNQYNLLDKLPSEIDLEHQKQWLKYRKYEYYQNHKESVDKYGKVLEEMKISIEEAQELKKYLDEKNLEMNPILKEEKPKTLFKRFINRNKK